MDSKTVVEMFSHPPGTVTLEEWLRPGPLSVFCATPEEAKILYGDPSVATPQGIIYAGNPEIVEG